MGFEGGGGVRHEKRKEFMAFVLWIGRQQTKSGLSICPKSPPPLHISASPQTIPQRQHQIEFVTTPATRAPCPRRTRSIPKLDLCSEACRPTWVTTAAPRAIIAVFNSGSTPPPDHGIFPCLAAAAARSLHMRLHYRVFVGGFEWNKRHARY